MRTRLGTLILLAALTATPTLMQPSATAATPPEATATRCHRTLAAYPILEPGDRGRAVRTLQCALNDVGAGRRHVVVDGWYGPQTRRAVRWIERGFEGPPPHPGRINNGMWTLLYGRQLPARVLHRGDQGRAVRILQRALRAAGGDLAVDGRFGPQTRGVVRAYQREHGYRATGRCNQECVFMLGQGGVFGDLT